MAKERKPVSDISQLVHDKRNPRKHNERNLKVIINSLHDVGFARSIVIDENNEILAGNGVTEAAVIAGIEKVIEVEADGNTIVAVRRRGLSDEQKQRLKYYDNRSSELAGWDNEQLLADLSEGMDLSAFWNQDELDALLEGMDDLDEPTETPTDTAAEVDRAEELGAKWQTAEGQIWRIGEHVVICGDCREPDTWQRLLQAANVDKVNGVFTSPPYAMQRKDQYGGVPTAEYVDWWEAVQANVKTNLASDGSFFVNIKAHCEDGQRVLYCMDLVAAMVRRWGWRFVDELCWRKAKDGYPGGYPNRFRDAFEPIYHFSVEKKLKFTKWNVAHQSENAFKYSPGNKSQNSTGSGFGLNGSGLEARDGLALPSNVLEIVEVNPDEALSQSAMFPVALPDFFIRAYSDPGDVWADPFLGSGTTIVAAHNNKRRGLGSEKLPKYLGVILERLATHTNTQPELISN